VLGLALLCASCARDEPERRVVLAAPLEVHERAPVLEWHPRGEEALLPAGTERVHELDLRPEASYTVRVCYEGARPTLLEASGGAREPLPLLAGRAGEGHVEHALERRRARARLVVRAGAGDVRLLSLVVARRPDLSGARAPAAGDAPGPITVFFDQRPGVLVRPGEPRVLPLTLPAHATRLASAVAADPRVPVTTRGRPRGRLRLVLEVDGRRQPLAERAVEGPSSRWDPIDVDVSRWAGRSVRLRLEHAGPPADGEAEALAVALPHVLCERGARRPNLVLVSLDTTRRDRLGMYGAEREVSPHLDAFAQRAIVFEDCLATAPYTLPSHATIFSGRFASGHGTTHPAHAIDVARTPLLAAILLEHGYRTRAFTGGGYLNAEYGFAHGFLAYGNLDPVRDLSAEGVAELAATRHGALFADAHAAQSWDAALAYLADSRDVPFFLFLQTFAIHDYSPPRAWRERFVTVPEPEDLDPMRGLPAQLETPFTDAELAWLSDVYDASIAWVDARLGELFAALDRHGLREHTVVVVTSDHGEAFGERGGLHGHGRSLHREMLEVPLLVAAPGIEGRRVAQRVSHVDLAPTLLDLLGIEAPDAMQGRSLRPLLEGRAPAGWPGPSPALAEVDSNITRARALHVGPLKIVTGDPDARVTLPTEEPLAVYDLRADPGELESVHARDPEATARLRRRLEALLEWAGRDRGTGPPARLSEETIGQLEALGYAEAVR